MKKFISVITLVSVLCLAGCGNSDSKTDKDELNNEILNELDENEINELEAELNGDTDKENTEDNAGEPASELNDAKYYTYYEDLAKAYENSGVTKGNGSLFYISESAPVYVNDKIYLSYGSSDSILYSYDISSGSLEKVFEFNASNSQDVFQYNSWYINNDTMYLLYDKDMFGPTHAEKISKDGIVTDFEISEMHFRNHISYVFDNGKILFDEKNSESDYCLYDPATGKLTEFNTIAVPSDHEGATQDLNNPVKIFANGNSFYFTQEPSKTMGKKSISDPTIYEYNTDTEETSVFFKDDILRNYNLSAELFGDYLMLNYEENYEKMVSVIKMSDGTRIIDNVHDYAPYHGGNGGYYRDLNTQKWYKLRYPDSTYPDKCDSVEILMEAGEEFAEETSVGSFIQLDDKYYIFKDDSGYFLRTYEKGSSDEKLIIAQSQIDDDLRKLRGDAE